jgi:DNA-binding response OmpR family regulator
MDMPSPSDARQARRVLVVDDDDTLRTDMAATLRDVGYEVVEAWSATQALRLVLAVRPNAVVLDLVLPDGNGVEVGRAMRAIAPSRHTCVVAVTSDPTSVASLDPRSFGAESILLKPVTPAALCAAVDRCFDPDGDELVGHGLPAQAK